MTVEEILDECKRMTAAKGQDYTTDVNVDRFENFSRCALVSGWFVSDRDKVYATLITLKLARLASLLGRDKDVKNESIKDTFIDLVNYSALWAGDRFQSDKPKESDSEIACCQIIEIASRLNPKHLRDSKDYLSALLDFK